MTLVSVSTMVFPEQLSQVTSTSSLLIDASGEKAASVFQVPKTGNITHVGFKTGTVTTPQTLRVELQTVDTTTGDPTGSAYGGMVKGTQASPASNTFYEVALGTQASATIGDIISAVVEFDGTVGNLNISYIASQIARSFPYTDLYTGSWAKSATSIPILTLKYDDGNYYDCQCVPYASVAASSAYNSGSTPDERALKFQVPFSCRAKGMWFYMIPAGATSDLDLVLYDSDGTTALKTVSFDANFFQTSASSRILTVLFTSSQILLKDTFYRISAKPTTANNITVYETTVNSAGMWDSMSGGQNCYRSTRTDAGAWTDTTTARPWAGIIIDQLDDGVSSGAENIFNIME